MEDLIPVDYCACIPRGIMTYQIKEELEGTPVDIQLTSTDDVMAIHDMKRNMQRILIS